MNANLAAPGPVGATERVPVVWRNRTVHIEYQWIAPERSDAPLVVLLHEGLGSVAMWKDFPRQLCDAGGLRGLVFSRPADRNTAKARRYDSIHTAALRAGYPGPFHDEGVAFAQWMDQCNAAGYQIMAEIEAGTRAPLSVDDYLALLPELVLP